MKKLALLSVLSLALASTLSAATVSVFSDGSTLAAATATDPILLDSAAGATGLTFVPALVGGFGSFTPVPSGAPGGTQVINIPPGDGESGYFEVFFTLPAGFTGASLSGAANVDDYGRAFLNGVAISPSLGSGISEFGDYAFSDSNQADFVVGTNVLLISDLNSGGGPSAAAFYANIAYNTSSTPEPGSLALLGSGLVMVAGGLRRKLL